MWNWLDEHPEASVVLVGGAALALLFLIIPAIQEAHLAASLMN